MVQWLGFHAFTAGSRGSVPGQETKLLHATKKEKKGRGGVLIFILEPT